MSTTSAQPAAAGRRAFLGSRLGSFLAIVPLGVWVIVHLWHNLAALQSPEAWQHAVTGYETSGAMILSSVIVLAPLLLHTIWGLGRLVTSRPNNLRYGFFANLKYLLQRLSAVGVLLFLGAHLWLAFFHPRVFEGHPERFADFAHEMRRDAATLPVYLLGTLGVSYHLANGIYGFAMTWGLAASRAALRGFERAAMATFVILLAMSWAAVYALWRAG
jgi:succinate dehydrogenase / fumarate reductase, cytochrome b subunit